MRRHIILFLALAAVLFGTLYPAVARQFEYHSPYMLGSPDEPDTTKVIYPIPVSGSPMDKLFNQSPLYLNDPENFTEEIIYDPVTGQYTFKRRIGDFYYDTPSTMTQNEFLDYQSKKGIMEYWKERRSQNGRSTTNGSSIIPPIYVGGKAFETIFGSNTIDIRPQGSVDLTFGIKHNYRKDPSKSERLQHTTNFDFDQQIQLNVIAKIGDKINFNINKNTKATFNYQDKMALKYEGKEDEILQLLEAGNVSFPLNSTLIRGTQSLFGIKTKLKFGNTTISGIVSYQESESQNINVQGGAQTSEFDINCLDYEENRHFFLSQYFRDRYEEALSTLPVVTSSINITKIEVWITNTNTATQDTRNILALTDLGESKPEWIYNPELTPAFTSTIYPRNAANDLLTRMDTTQIRSISTVTNYMTNDPLRIGKTGYMVAGRDFEKIENARRLSSTEYSFNPQLGFISLNINLNSNQTLAVAYQYTIVGQNDVFQVGEFSDQGITTPKVLVAKLLRGTTVNTKMPIWNLMMKNVYNIRAFQVSQQDFMLNIFYNGNNSKTPMGYFSEGPDNVTFVPLIHLFGVDNLSTQNNPVPGGDGVFDFLDRAATQGGTINSATGRIYFPVLEPFGSHIHKKIFPNDPDLANKYAYDSLYTMTKTSAEQYSEKNKFNIKGMYSSSSGSEISLNAMNVAQGSVHVSAGGAQLVENVDYTVDYTLGRVTIINEGILNSGTPINITLESNNSFSALKKTFLGARVEHEFSQDFRIGGTVLYLGEKSYTQKISYGDEAVSNTIYGADISYHTEARWLTTFINALPGISTKSPSRINFDGEFARFIPGLTKSASERGTSYIDDFEGAKSTIDLRLPVSWQLASTPQNQTDLFPEAAPGTGLDYGKNRAKLAWYTIDNTVFYNSSNAYRPNNIDQNELSKNSVRQVLETELFPTKDIASGTPTNISVLNLAYYPEERGPYNYDVEATPYSAGIDSEGNLSNPASRWGGIMRKMESTDFEATNIEYLEFWLMDPFADEEYQNNPGKLYINFGDISEDILRDGRKFYENGLPISEVVENVDTTIWGRVPTMQDLVGTFSNESNARQFQDVGLDGLRDVDERSFFEDTYLNIIRSRFGEASNAYTQANGDPSGDNFHFYRSSEWDRADEEEHRSILARYKNFNGPDGNSPSDIQRTETYTTSSTTLPDGEDINNDNTLSETERYYQYVIDLDPAQMVVGKNHIADIHEATNVALANGEIGSMRWYQFRVPIKQPDKVIGRIDDYSSIRFMRMFVREFQRPIVLRFATLDLVRGEWRTYSQSIQAPGEYQPNDVSNNTTFDISAVNLDENSRRDPVPYVIPPGIQQEQVIGTTAITKVNEQSMQLTVQNLVDGDGRAVYKTADFDFRQYKYLKMFIHAEAAQEEDPLADQDITVFLRLGTDFTENYYEYEVPVKVTPWHTSYTNKEGIWPEINNMEILLEDLVEVKANRNAAMNQPNSDVRLNYIYSEKIKKGTVDGQNYYHTIKVIGNPSISDVKAMMIGVRNPKRQSASSYDDGQPKSAVVWVNELRLTELNSKGGVAGTGRLEVTLADLGRVSLNGSYSSAGFGALDSRITSNEFVANSALAVSTDLELGKFFENTGLKIPVHFDYGQNKANPKYNPYDPDVKLDDALAALENKVQRDSLTSIIHDYTRYTNVNLMNVRKERVQKRRNFDDEGEGQQKANERNPNRGMRQQNTPKVHIYDIENFRLSFSYNETYQENTNIQYASTKSYRGGIGYNYAGNPKNVTPFANAKWAAKPSMQIFKDVNFYYLPKTISISTEMYRYYSESQMRNKSGGMIILNPAISKQWDWSRNYQLRYDLTKALNFEYSAQAQAYIYEPAGKLDKNSSDWKPKHDTIMNELRHFGSMSRFQQNVSASYTLPINKIPILNWINVSANYQGTYFWNASAMSIQSRMGNTIENTNNISGNANLDLTKLYNKVPYLKTINTPKRNNNNQNGRGRNPKEESEKEDSSDTTKMKKKESVNVGKAILDNTLRILTMVKKVSATYNQTNGQTLPGFMPKSKILGMDVHNGWAPTFGFVLGGGRNVYERAVKEQWLTTDSILSSPYARRKTEVINYRVNAEPFFGFKIDITGNRNYGESYQHYFRANKEGIFETFTPTYGGNFTMSYFMMGTAFIGEYTDGSEGSPLFDRLLSNRKIIAERIAKDNPQWLEHVNNYVYDTVARDYFPQGYNAGSMEVLMYSFIAAYSGKDAKTMKLNPFPKFPLPNWNVSFNGLTNIPAIGKLFKTVNLTHSYKSSYAISSWATNLNYDPKNTIQTFENTDIIIPQYDIRQMVISEQFQPLIGVDLGLQNSMTLNFQFKKSRTLTLSFANNQLTEVSGREIVIGAGYRIKDLSFNVISLTGDGKGKTVKNDLVIKLDLGFKRDKTILRRIDENNNQVSAGQNKINIYLTADYTFSQRLSGQVFIKHDMSDPFVANNFKNTQTFGGVSLRFNLAQ